MLKGGVNWTNYVQLPTLVLEGVVASWRVRDARACVSEFLEAAVRTGPQAVTRNGVEVAVLLAIQEWRKLLEARGPSLRALLLAPKGRFEFEKRPPVNSRLKKNCTIEIPQHRQSENRVW